MKFDDDPVPSQTLEQQLAFVGELQKDFMDRHGRWVHYEDYDNSWQDIASKLDQVAESIWRLIELEK